MVIHTHTHTHTHTQEMKEYTECCSWWFKIKIFNINFLTTFSQQPNKFWKNPEAKTKLTTTHYKSSSKNGKKCEKMKKYIYKAVAVDNSRFKCCL